MEMGEKEVMLVKSGNVAEIWQRCTLLRWATLLNVREILSVEL